MRSNWSIIVDKATSDGGPVTRKQWRGLGRIGVSLLRGLLLVWCAVLFHVPASAVLRESVLGPIDPANLGKGDWIFSLKDATNRLGGQVSSVTNEASLMQYYNSQGIRYIIIKAGTGTNFYSGCYISPCQLTSNLVNVAHTYNVMVFGY